MQTDTVTPIQAYFAQGLRGRSTWPYWTTGLFLALFIWIAAQLVLGIALFAVAMANPEMLEMIMGMQGEAQAANSLAMAAGGIVAGGGILALILGLIGATRKPHPSAGLMTAAGIISIVGLIATFYLLGQNDPAEVDLMTQMVSQSPVMYLLMLLGFPPLIFSLWFVLKLIHGRSFKSMLTAHTHFRWGRVIQTMIIYWGVMIAVSVICHVIGLNPINMVFDGSKFIPYLIVSLLFIPLQSATEELILRGYMNQGLGKYIRNPWIVFFITSAAFASLHLANPEAAAGASEGKLLITMSGYFFFGFVACILTYIDGGLESAIGMHVANNLYAAVLLGYDNSALPTPTVFKTTLNANTDWIVTLVALAIATFLLWKTRPTLVPDMPSRADLEDDISTEFS